MSLQFQDWSKLVPSVIMQRKYQEKGWTFPSEGPCLIKVFVSSEAELENLKQWAQQRDLSLDLGRAGRREEQIDWRDVHIDLYGPSLEYALKEKVLTKEEVISQRETQTGTHTSLRGEVNKKGFRPFIGEGEHRL